MASTSADCSHCSDNACDSTLHGQRKTARIARTRTKVAIVRVLALLCACSLSVGSHYGSYFLGPLKSRLAREIGTDNTEFSLLIAAYNLNSTWTPLVGGLLVARLGTTFASILATSLVLLGQSILLLGSLTGMLPLMALGMFIFGLGISPINVVQETIIVRFFSTKGLGLSLALGLMVGKGASFVSAWSSFPLSEWDPSAPFIVSTGLALLSFLINLVYISFSEWFAREAELDDDAAELDLPVGHTRAALGKSSVSTAKVLTNEEAAAEVAEKRQVRVSDLTLLGDVFWTYMAVNVLCGAIWSPFTHLAANIIEQRYDLTELEAGRQASLLLAGSVALYPICGYLTDRLRRTQISYHLFTLSSLLTLFCYAYLALPPSYTKTPAPGLWAFGTGHGFSTLLLVIIVPGLVPLRWVSTALGAHKSIEQAGSTISQTLAGFLLDTKKNKLPATPPPSTSPHQLSTSTPRLLFSAYTSLSSIFSHFTTSTPSSISLSFEKTPSTANPQSIQLLLNTYLFINVLQLAGTLLLWRLDVGRKRRIAKEIQEREAARQAEAAAAVSSAVREGEVGGAGGAVPWPRRVGTVEEADETAMTTTAASVPWPRKKTVEEPQPATQGDGVAPSSSSSSSPASGQSGITAVDPPLHPDGNGQEEEDCEDWEGCDAPDCCRIVDSSTLPPVIATSSDPERQPLLSASHTHANTHIRYSSTTTNVSRPRSLSSTNTPRPLLRPSTTRPTYSKINPCSHTQQLLLAGLGQLAEQKRGRWFLGMFVGVLGSAWGVFLGGVMWKLARR